MVGKKVGQIAVIDTALLIKIVEQIVGNGFISGISRLGEKVVNPTEHIKGHVAASVNMENIFIEIFGNDRTRKSNRHQLSVIGQNRQERPFFDTAKVAGIFRGEDKAVVFVVIGVPRFVCDENLEFIVISRHLTFILP